MLLRVIVVRHGNAPSLPPPAGDRERVLDARGKREADWLGVTLAERGWWPDVVMTSDAPRAVETWHRMERSFTGPIALRFEPSLYAIGADAAVNLLAGLGGERTACVVGHNPEWERLVQWWTGELVAMGTANAALLEGQADGWSGLVGPRRMTLVDMIRPA